MEHEHHHEHEGSISSIILFSLGLICLISGIALHSVDTSIYREFSFSYFLDPSFYTSLSFFSFLAYTIGYLPLLVKTSMQCIEEIKEGEIFNEFLLMIIATIGAFFLGEFMEALFVLLFSIIGELLEDFATSRSKKRIETLVNDMPLLAHLVKEDGSIEEKDPSEIQIGDILEIKPGEKVPLDGVILSGASSFDLSSLNGESMPQEKKEGDAIYSGSINLSSLIRIRVEKTFENSTLSKIMNLVQEEQSKQAKTERFITKFASIYTPIVILIAALVFLVGFGLSGWNFQSGGKDWLYKALSILLVSCPCALVISTPITFFSGIGSASKLGILIKGSIAIENMAKTDVALFDKTGTLTEGKFTLQNEIDPLSHQIAASLESKSTHPLAKAICASYQGELLPIDSFENIPGRGVKGTIGSKEYLIGSKSLLAENNIDVPSFDPSYQAIFLADLETKQVTSFLLSDTIKKDAKDCILALKEQGIKETAILSGDEKNIAERVKDSIGIDTAYAPLLPAEKLDIIKEKQKDHKTIFVGDGINDSPSILRSDVGIAMGALGSDAAIEASDIVILNDDLRKVSEAKRLSKKTMRVAVEGVILSLALKLIIMVFVASGLLGSFAMIVASLADTGVLVLCVLNAIRMMFYKPKYLKK